MFKAGTVKDLSQYEGEIPSDVYREALRIVSMLDREYGTDRDVDYGDGGFVLIAENVQDVEFIGQTYRLLDGGACEAVDVLKYEGGLYVNVLFLHNNEFGVNVLMPFEIAPETLLRDLPEKAEWRQ